MGAHELYDTARAIVAEHKGILAADESTSANGVPSSALWRSVSSKRITPPIESSIPGAVKRSCR